MTELIIIAILSIACIVSGIELIKDQKKLETYQRLYDLRKELQANHELFINNQISMEAYQRNMTDIRLEVEQLESEIE